MQQESRLLEGKSTGAAAAQPQLMAQKSPAPERHHRWRLLVWGAAAAMALFCGYLLSRSAGVTPAHGLPTVKVRSGTVERAIRVTGSTAAVRGVMLRAPYLRGSRHRGGAHDFQLDLTDMAKPGTRVEEGEVVAVFDSQNMRTRLDDMMADRVVLENSLKRLLADQLAEAEAHDQKIRMARASVETARLDLQTAPIRSVIQAQIFRLALEEAQATYKALVEEKNYLNVKQSAERRLIELNVEDARLEERRAQANLDRLTVRSPISGLAVSQEIYRGGDYGEVRSGDQIRPGQPYLRIVDLRSMIVEATANQADVLDVRIGQPAHIGLDAYPGLRLFGRVSAVGAIARTAAARPSFVAEVPVTISISGADPKLIPSLSASGDIVLDASERGPILPREAVFSGDEGGEPYAYVRTDSGWERRALVLGAQNNLSVAVRAGVAEGESVALEEPPEWVDRPGEMTAVNAAPEAEAQ
jgi:HlyD family secretion protein